MRHFVILILISISSLKLQASEYRELQWDDLMPEAELKILQGISELITNPHQPLDPNENIRDDINSGMKQMMDPDVQGVMSSINTRPELNNQDVSIPGFIVPVETNGKGGITEFFLVPYFGACIHVPPPPPNQIIYVRYKQGLVVDGIWMPFVIKGTLFTELVDNDIAVSAYTFNAVEVIEYKD